MTSEPSILIINAGSSSIKSGLFTPSGGDHPFLTLNVERIGSNTPEAFLKRGGEERMHLTVPEEEGQDSARASAWLLGTLQREGLSVAVAGHRFVHGGEDFEHPVLITSEIIHALENLVPLARTHQPHALAGVAAVHAIMPDIPQIACFDTAFHATLSEKARTYALPKRIRDLGVRRYGFHGLSYEWIASQLPHHLKKPARRVVVAHLGNGASLCGMVDGKSQAITMGFTPLDGLVMGERPGLLDPGAVLFFLEELQMDIEEVRRMLFKESGLKGLSGLSNDMRTLLASDEPDAALALDVYVHRAIREIGAMAAEIGGVEALVFTGGVGENSPEIRTRITHGCAWLGDIEIAVIPTNEEAVIARAVRAFDLVS